MCAPEARRNSLNVVDRSFDESRVDEWACTYVSAVFKLCEELKRLLMLLGRSAIGFCELYPSVARHATLTLHLRRGGSNFNLAMDFETARAGQCSR